MTTAHVKDAAAIAAARWTKLPREQKELAQIFRDELLREHLRNFNERFSDKHLSGKVPKIHQDTANRPL